MAKRYKTSEKSNPHQKKRRRDSRKIDKRKVLVFFVIIIILIVGYFIITNINTRTDNEVKISNSDKKISSDILVLNDLNNEIIEHLDLGNMQLVKAHYKLESLEKGTTSLYYKVDDREIVKVDINISDKKIEKAEKQENAEEISLAQIENNMSRDLKKYFENNQKRLKPDEGKNILNIIVANDQIIINASES
ncbi:MAG: hypothetical protein KIC54_07325 [Clostridium sp.]|nr:hypothetical protein [Clostridium sp.]